MIVESTRPPKWRAEGTLWGSRDLRDWQPYVVAGQIFIFLFMVVEFGAVIPYPPSSPSRSRWWASASRSSLRPGWSCASR